MRTETMFVIGRARWVSAFLVLMTLATPLAAQAQYYLVDCSGANWWAFPTITSALQYVSWPGANIAVTGSCDNEYFLDSSGHLRAGLQINQKHDIRIGAYWGQTASVSGGIYAANSDGVYLYGLTTTNAYGNGIEVDKSRVILDTCSSSGNQANGLLLENSSYGEVDATGSFSDNGAFGLNVGGGSFLGLAPWAGPVEVRRNKGGGIWASQGDVATGGNTFISDSGGFAVDFRGGAKGQFGNWAGPNLIENNPNGGVSLQENAEISLWACCSNPVSVIRNNGFFGIAAGFGSQVTLAGAQVSDNAGPGVDVYAHSQLYATSILQGLGGNQILRNGSASDPMSAAVRVDGNSEALLRGGDISQNTGLGILALVNSSVDFAGVNFTGNTAGVIGCDSTAAMASDLSASQSTPASGVSCKSPHGPVNRSAPKITSTNADVNRFKALQQDYRNATKGVALNAPQQ